MPAIDIAVWDLGVRIFHWSLVLSVGICAYTGFLGPRNRLNLHLIFGCLIAALILFRLVWGWLGSTYARFRSFTVTRSGVIQHLNEIKTGKHHAALGHNPLGAAMVYALLAVLSLIIITGAIALGGVVKQGPLAFLLSFRVGTNARDIHQALAIGLLCMIAAHLGGVIFESRRMGANLVRAMITGKKPAQGTVSMPTSGAQPWTAAIILAVLAVGIVPAVLTLQHLPGFGVPPATLDATYVKECGSCHFAYPPSLSPASSWVAMMGGPDAHFGENASLDSATATKIRDYLVANAAENWDTRPANAFRIRNADDPLRITATPTWQRIHRGIPDAVFKSPKIGVKGACNACHQDAATSRFDPQFIAIPQEAHP